MLIKSVIVSIPVDIQEENKAFLKHHLVEFFFFIEKGTKVLLTNKALLLTVPERSGSNPIRYKSKKCFLDL